MGNTSNTDPFSGLQGGLGSYLSTDKLNSAVTFTPLVNMIQELGIDVKGKIASIRGKKSAMSIADMFDLQSAVQKLAQFTEMSSSVLSSINGSLSTMSRNMKG